MKFRKLKLLAFFAMSMLVFSCTYASESQIKTDENTYLVESSDLVEFAKANQSETKDYVSHNLLAFNANQPESKVTVKDYYNVSFAKNNALEAKPILVQTSPQEVADIVDQISQAVVSQIETAPNKGAPVASWITWSLTAVMSLIGVLTGIFFSGNKRDFTLD